MLIKGALHVHTNLSHDGSLSFAEIARLYRAKGYQFVGISDHSQDLDSASLARMREEAARNSDRDFLIIPGVEYSCPGRMHIVGIGSDVEYDTTDPKLVVRSIRAAGGFSIIAHPRRVGWQCPADLLDEANAIEVWNARYDRKYCPDPAGFRMLMHARIGNPNLLAIVGDDLHQSNGFRPTTVLVRTDSLSRDAILSSLIRGQYRLRINGWSLAASERPGRQFLLSAQINRHLFNQASNLLELSRKVRTSLVQSR